MLKSINFASEEDVTEYFAKDAQGRQVIIFEGKVYDVKDFMQSHPGGPETIQEHLGKNIEGPFEEAEHTKKARQILLALPVIGFIDNQGGTQKPEKEQGSEGTAKLHLTTLDGKSYKDQLQFDFDKPLYPQFVEKNITFDQYMEFLHEPKILVNPVRSVILFENPLLEFMTKCPWWGMVIFHGIDIARQLANIKSFDTETVLIMICGAFGWTLLESLLHKWVFHSEHFWLRSVFGDNHAVFAAHSVTHGMHHAFPTDPLRMVEPPLITHCIAHFILFPQIYQRLFTNWEVVSVGTIIGYVCYDLFHFYLHMGSLQSETLKNYRSYHMKHHYNEGKYQFGVTTWIWDDIFGDSREGRLVRKNDDRNTFDNNQSELRAES